MSASEYQIFHGSPSLLCVGIFVKGNFQIKAMVKFNHFANSFIIKARYGTCSVCGTSEYIFERLAWLIILHFSDRCSEFGDLRIGKTCHKLLSV